MSENPNTAQTSVLGRKKPTPCLVDFQAVLALNGVGMGKKPISTPHQPVRCCSPAFADKSFIAAPGFEPGLG
jgi:hypothetical protein